MISVQDTHRLLYKNAVIRAYDFDNRTERVSFVNAEGVVVGKELRTNEQGYLVNAEGTHQITSYFVQKKSIIQVSLDGGSSWPIEYIVDTSIDEDSIGNGKLRASDGGIVWEANANYDKTLDYNDLAHRPNIHPWGEVEQTEDLTGTGDNSITVREFTSLLILTSNDSADKIVRLAPDGKRYGQKVIVLNATTRPIEIYGADNTRLMTLPSVQSRVLYTASTSNKSVGFFVTYQPEVPEIPSYIYNRSVTQIVDLVQARTLVNINSNTAVLVLNLTMDAPYSNKNDQAITVALNATPNCAGTVKIVVMYNGQNPITKRNRVKICNASDDEYFSMSHGDTGEITVTEDGGILGGHQTINTNEFVLINARGDSPDSVTGKATLVADPDNYKTVTPGVKTVFIGIASVVSGTNEVDIQLFVPPGYKSNDYLNKPINLIFNADSSGRDFGFFKLQIMTWDATSVMYKPHKIMYARNDRSGAPSVEMTEDASIWPGQVITIVNIGDIWAVTL